MTWPGSEVSILIENGGSNEGIIGTPTPIEGADYRNGFGQVPGGAQFSIQKVAFGISPKYVFSAGDFITSPQASAAQLEWFHAPSYVHALQRADATGVVPADAAM